MLHLYPVNEIFLSVQGEGARTGTLNHFIRFSGCNCHCSFCDTDHEKFEMLSTDEIIARLYEQGPCESVVLTGGEPTIHDLGPLLTELKDWYFIAMETNGILLGERFSSCPAYDYIDWLTVSPKTRLIDCDWKQIDEVKYVIPNHEDLIQWDAGDYGALIYLQPEWSQGESAVQRCIELMHEHPRAQLSVQLHKMLGLK